MKESTRKAREQLKQDKMLAKVLGLSLEEVQAQRAKEDADDKVREAQAILLFIEKPDAFISKKCDNCKQQFLTSYQFVTVCSTTCRAESLAKVGIIWNPLRSREERWARSQIPVEYSIPPKALQVLLELAVEQDLTEAVNNADPNDFPELASEPPEETSSTPPSNNELQESIDAELPLSAELEVEDFFR